MEDFQGLKIRVHGGAALAAAKLGWIGVSIPWEEIAVQSAEHLVDAACFPVPVTGRDAGLDTIYPYYVTPFPVYQFHFATVMNLDKWNAIPADLQAIINTVCDESVDDALNYVAGRIEGGIAAMHAEGVQWIDWPSAEMDKFRSMAGEPVWADWVVQMNDQGLPGQKILDTFQELLAKYKASSQ